MKAIVQEEETGCGLACVAMLAGESYQTVREAAAGRGIYAGDDALYSDTAYVRRLLAHYGIKAAPEETPFAAPGAEPGPGRQGAATIGEGQGK